MTSLSTPCPASSGPVRDEEGGAGHRQPDPAVLATHGPGLAEHVGDGGGFGGPRPGDGDRWFILTVEGVAVLPEHEQRPAASPVDLERMERRRVAGLGAGPGPRARKL